MIKVIYFTSCKAELKQVYHVSIIEIQLIIKKIIRYKQIMVMIFYEAFLFNSRNIPNNN